MLNLDDRWFLYIWKHQQMQSQKSDYNKGTESNKTLITRPIFFSGKYPYKPQDLSSFKF